MSKKIALVLVLGVVIVGIFLLIEQDGPAPLTADEFAGEEIVIGGSRSVSPVIGQKLADAYMKKYPQRKIITHDPTGSGGAIQGTDVGVLSVGFTSRPMKEGEKTKFPSLKYHLPIKDGLVFVVSSDVDVKNLSTQQILDIYRGKITNWSELGGADAVITVFDRTTATSPKVTLTEILRFFPEGFQFGERVIDIGSPDGMDTAVETTPSAIGYTSFGTIKLRNLKVKMIGLDGVFPTIETIRSGTFPLYREMGFVTKGDPSGLLADFVDYIFSSEGKKIIESSGFIATF